MFSSAACQPSVKGIDWIYSELWMKCPPTHTHAHTLNPWRLCAPFLCLHSSTILPKAIHVSPCWCHRWASWFRLLRVGALLGHMTPPPPPPPLRWKGFYGSLCSHCLEEFGGTCSSDGVPYACAHVKVPFIKEILLISHYYMLRNLVDFSFIGRMCFNEWASARCWRRFPVELSAWTHPRHEESFATSHNSCAGVRE